MSFVALVPGWIRGITDMLDQYEAKLGGVQEVLLSIHKPTCCWDPEQRRTNNLPHPSPHRPFLDGDQEGIEWRSPDPLHTCLAHRGAATQRLDIGPIEEQDEQENMKGGGLQGMAAFPSSSRHPSLPPAGKAAPYRTCHAHSCPPGPAPSRPVLRHPPPAGPQPPRLGNPPQGRRRSKRPARVLCLRLHRPRQRPPPCRCVAQYTDSQLR